MTDRITVALVGGPFDGRLLDLEAQALNLPLHVATGSPLGLAIQTTYRFTGNTDDHGVRRFSCLPDGW